jgi:hypothetical protein
MQKVTYFQIKIHNSFSHDLRHSAKQQITKLRRLGNELEAIDRTAKKDPA